MRALFASITALRLSTAMHSLEALDIALFRFINGKLANPVLDALMPFVSGNAFFFPLLALVAIALLWKGGVRGVIFLLVLGAVIAIGDGWLCREIKQAVGRARPFLVLEDVRCLVGRSGSFSLPSNHAANWFAATTVAFLYYRRSLWLMLPLALMVAFSRVYNGVHYPGDVLAAAVLGAGYAIATVWLLNSIWQAVGRRWFPLWWEAFPSVLAPNPRAPSEADDQPHFAPRLRPGAAPAPAHIARHVSLDEHWLRLGYLVIALLLLARLFYLASGVIQLSEDESYQWLWSKHLALSYYSKPPLIAYTQFLGTSLWGDNEFGVRFFSPVIAAILSVIMLRFFARELNARAGFFLLLIVTATPMLAVGSVLMTVDPLSVLFWTAAMLSGWRAIRSEPSSALGPWLWTGLWMGLGFLSKYTQLFQLLCWLVFFSLHAPARKHFRRPGPYLALLLNLLLAAPVIIWNAQNSWITFFHVKDSAGAGHHWTPTLSFFLEFIGAEAGLLNPVFFVGAIWASVSFWRRQRRNPLFLYFFSMGAPVFLAYLFWSFHSRIFPNWIAPSILPLFCLMTAYWDARLRLGMGESIKCWLALGLGVGLVVVLLAHNTDLVARFTGGRRLPIGLDPLRRVRGWSETARIAVERRNELLLEGKPVFIIADHYGLAGEISFYLPQAKAAVKEQPLVYYQHSDFPRNQFYFWPGYTNRPGENAIFVHELDRVDPKPIAAPEFLQGEFKTVTDLGAREVVYRGQIIRRLQFFACHYLKAE
jgi:4-amino-4-deoxy-L-arabinose transferase-like glycosyltransferase/membrane-associated phospholipid phosphatase